LFEGSELINYISEILKKVDIFGILEISAVVITSGYSLLYLLPITIYPSFSSSWLDRDLLKIGAIGGNSLVVYIGLADPTDEGICLGIWLARLLPRLNLKGREVYTICTLSYSYTLNRYSLSRVLYPLVPPYSIYAFVLISLLLG
jgi:hypothetical protein